MPTLVMKFGGTSVANLDRIARAAKRVAVEVANGYVGQNQWAGRLGQRDFAAL